MNLPNLSQEDILKRLYGYLPTSWFGEDSKNLHSIMEGAAQAFLWVYQLEQFANYQLRIAAATGDTLDAISKDFFGGFLHRGLNESDDSFRKKIQAILLKEKATRPAMENILEYITGNKPLIIEGGSSSGAFAWDVSAYDMGVPFGTGDGSLAYQCFITVYLNSGVGIPTPYSGYAGNATPGFPSGEALGGYDLNSSQCIAPLCYGDDIESYLTTTLILNVINLFKPVGTICWVKFAEV